MANLKELRGRIKSIGSIAQITKAMEMVASMKLRKVQGKAVANRPYTLDIRAMVEHLAGSCGEEAGLSLLRRREVRTSGVFLITSDRGLCGSYNANVLGTFTGWKDEVLAAHPERKIKLFCYGKKGYSFLNRRGYDIERFFVEPPLDKADFSAARMVAQALVAAFEDGTVDEVRLFYTHFASVARFRPSNDAFLPVGIEVGSEGWRDDYILEPSPEMIFDRLIPRYLETMVYDAMLQSLASEHASRRMAMKGATDAATSMGKDLKKIYNRARQENITRELLDIIGGANAVQ